MNHSLIVLGQSEAEDRGQRTRTADNKDPRPRPRPRPGERLCGMIGVVSTSFG